MITKIQLRRDIAENWTNANPVLDDGEVGIEKNTRKFKFGNGSTSWNDLPYVIDGQIPTKISQLEDDAGFITINDVEAAGFTKNIGTVTAINNIEPDVNGNVTIAIPTSTEDLSNDSGFITIDDVATEGYTKNKGTVTQVNDSTPDANGNVSLAIPSKTSDLTNDSNFTTLDAVTGQGYAKSVDVAGTYQTKITSSAKLSADLLSEGTTNKLVSASEKTTWNEKQDAINDLDGIRSGASAGATAVQPNDMTTAISTHNTSSQAHTDIRGLITTETTNRENADIGLQNQIDAITASSDVKDIVGTYAQLQAYDTSTLGNNDIIKVLQDETHDDGTTYYRWSTETQSFTLIGEEGPYYTKSEADSTFVPKTRTVNGKELISNISLDASDVGALPYNTFIPTDTSDLTNGAGFITGITSSDVTTALGYTPPTINLSNNYVPYRSSATAFSNSTLMYNPSAMAFTGKLHVGSSSPATYSSKGRFTIYDNTPSQQVSSLALLNYGGGGGCGVAIDMYNTSANGGIPSGRFGVIDNGNYSGYLQLQVKKSGAESNPLLPAMNIVPVPASNSLTTCVSFGQDEFNRVLFDLHKPETGATLSDPNCRWSGSGTTYQVIGSNKFNSRLLVAVGDIVSFNNFSTEARVVNVVSSSTTCQITTDVSLGSVSSAYISVKKAYFKITDENYNTKVYIDPYGKLGIGTGTPAYDLDVSGTINATTDVKINGQSVALPSQTGQSGKFLTTDGTDASWGTLNALQNIATGNGSLTILGTASTGTNCLNIGKSSGAYGIGSVRIGNDGFANQLSTAIGYSANAGGNGSSNSIAIGHNSSAGTGQNSYCIAIGNETVCQGFGSVSLGSRGAILQEEGVFQVNLSKYNSGLYESHSFKLLDYTGKIPDSRLPIAASVSSSSTNAEVVGAKLFYDTVGDIESTINTIRGV